MNINTPVVRLSHLKDTRLVLARDICRIFYWDNGCYLEVIGVCIGCVKRRIDSKKRLIDRVLPGEQWIRTGWIR